MIIYKVIIDEKPPIEFSTVGDERIVSVHQIGDRLEIWIQGDEKTCEARQRWVLEEALV